MLVPADSFYEWKQHKIPMRFVFKNREPFCFAGIWDIWNKPDGQIPCFAILTTEANAVVSDVHNRMPLTVAPNNYDAWLDVQSNADESVLKYSFGDWEYYRVNDLINKGGTKVPNVSNQQRTRFLLSRICCEILIP